MRLVQFPDGDILELAPGMVYSLSSSTLNVNYNGTAVKNFNYLDNVSASLARQQIINTQDGPATNGPTYAFGDWPIIFSITPNPFNFANGMAAITIIGTNFTEGGTLWLEDAYGGMDFNSGSMTCTLVDSQTMTAVWASDGDLGELTAGPILYQFKGASNKLSQLFYGSTDGSRNFTVNL